VDLHGGPVNKSSPRTAALFLSGLFSILAFTTVLLYFLGPAGANLVALGLTLLFSALAWYFARRKPAAALSEQAALAAFDRERLWIIRALAEKLNTDAVELVVDPASNGAGPLTERVVVLEVRVDGRTLDKRLLLPLPAGVVDAGSVETARFLVREQIRKNF
jgi:hypothetical protein